MTSVRSITAAKEYDSDDNVKNALMKKAVAIDFIVVWMACTAAMLRIGRGKVECGRWKLSWRRAEGSGGPAFDPLASAFGAAVCGLYAVCGFSFAEIRAGSLDFHLEFGVWSLEFGLTVGRYLGMFGMDASEYFLY